MPCPTPPSQRHRELLAALRSDEAATWICYCQEDDAPFIVVRGWAGLVRRLAMDCIDVAASPMALSQAEAWLLDDGAWHFGVDGSTSWRIVLPDGAWAATLMIEGRNLEQAKRAFLG